MAKMPHHFGALSPEYVLLGFLYEGPNHGYTLHQQLVNELGHVWHVSQSQTYAILKRLEVQEFISSVTVEQEKLPPLHFLELTGTGRRRFEDWLQTSSGSSLRAVRLDFISRLYFAQRLFPEMIPAMFEAESADINTALAQMEKDRDAVPPEQAFNHLGLDLRIRQLHSARDWLIECRKAFETKF
jgi:DNA-binding PadR family transcriptional regulator